jgi:GNAT superfamily N-acetyltransferase
MRRAAMPMGQPSPRFTLQIRPAEASDIVSVIKLDEKVTGLAKHDFWHEIFVRFHESRYKRSFLLVAEGPDRSGNARLLGFIAGEVRAWEFGSAPCGWVIALSVEPEARLHGIGEALFEAISAEFKKAGVSKMRTMVARGNRLPLMFFRSEGMMAGPYIQLEKDLD